MITNLSSASLLNFTGKKRASKKTRDNSDFYYYEESKSNDGHDGFFSRISDSAQEKTKRIKDVIKPSAKYAGVALFTGIGFFTGKYMFSSQIAKNCFKFFGDLAKNVTKIDLNDKLNLLSDKALVILKNFKENKYPLIDKLLGSKKESILKFIKEFSQKGVDSKAVKEISETLGLNHKIVFDRACAKNAGLKALGALFGLFTGYKYFNESLKTDAEEMPDLFKKKATSIVGIATGL